MGQTPRQRLTQIPLPTRSSEASSECFGRVVLSYLREDDQADASFFILGNILHRIIEDTINNDWDLDGAKSEMVDWIEQAHSDIGSGEYVKIESSQRGFDSMYDDADRMITNWFNHVHPDGEKRHPVYDEYTWPPQTELEFYRTDLGTRYPVWGSIDAVFHGKDKLQWEQGRGANVMIVDWKSGVKRPDSDMQLNFYRFGTGWVDAPAHYHMLDRVQKRSIVVEADPYQDSAEVKRAISLTERRKDAILRGYFPKFTPGWYCGYCPVQHVCPADGDVRNRDGNRRQLEKLLKKAEPMKEIER